MFSWGLPISESALGALSASCSTEDGCRNTDDSLLGAVLRGRAEAWLQPGGQSYLAISHQGQLEILVHPKLRGQGLGSALLELGLKRARELSIPRVFLWAYGDNPKTVSWLKRNHFSSLKVLYSLARPWHELEPVLWDGGFRLRPFRLEDELVWLSLHRSLQREPAQAFSLDRLRAQLDAPLTPASKFYLLWQEEVLRGYLWFKAQEIFMFAIAPEVRGQGLGAKLLTWALGRLGDEAFAYCDDRRPAALALYKKLNFQERGRDRCLERRLLR